MWFRSILLGLLLITPLAAGAAGFAKESLFLSKSPVTEGETVFIHAIVTNDSSAAFAGEVVFKDGDVRIGAVAVTLPPGGAEATSVSWQPAKGSHSVTAELTAGDGTVVESASATFVIEERPEADTEEEAAASTSVESSKGIQETIAGISPQAASAAAPVFGTIDSLREKGVRALETGEAWAKTKAGQGEVAGESSETSGIAGTVMGLVATLLLYLFSALKWLLNNAGIFYPVLAIAFFYFLWRLYKRMRRPRYR